MKIISRRLYHFLLCAISYTVISNTIRLISINVAETQAPATSNPVFNLCFMKTHKTGSSTLQNILVRYAWNHELTIGLPQSDNLFLSYYDGKKFSSEEIQPLPRGYKVNMILHHMVFNHREISSLLPEDAVYVTILRDPATLFRSAFHYFARNVSAFGRASSDGFTAFVNDPSRYFKGRGDGSFWWLAKNSMFFDLGYDNLNESESYIKQAISETEETFDLILITEYFDVGMLLLKEKLNWRIEDVAYAAMNVQRRTRKENPDDDTIKKIYKWNQADTILYKYFNDTLWDKVKEYGEDKMKKDLIELEYVKANYRKNCFEQEMISNSKVTDKSLKMFNPPDIDVAQYQLLNAMIGNETCISLIRPELQWWKKLVVRQKMIKTLMEGSDSIVGSESRRQSQLRDNVKFLALAVDAEKLDGVYSAACTCGAIRRSHLHTRNQQDRISFGDCATPLCAHS